MAMPTVEQVKTNEGLLRQIQRGVSGMIQAHRLVLIGTAGTVDLTDDQKQELIDDYLTKKAEIATLYAGLL